MAHEDLSRTHAVKTSSERAFGFVFAGAFGVITAWPLVTGGSVRWWAAGVAAAFLAISLIRPGLLAGLNRLWTRFGLLLGRIVSPLALGVLFYGIITPLGWLMRLTGKDVLRLKPDPAARSYWIARDPPGPPRDSMGNQF